MSAQQELIERLRHHASSAPVISRQSIDMDAAADRLASLTAELDALKAEVERLRVIAHGAASMRLIDAEDVKGEIVFRFTMPGNQLFNPPKFWIDARAALGGGG